MVCAVCGQEGARSRRVTRSYGKGETILIIENVPVGSCPHCGTSYLTAQTLHEIDRIKRHRHELAMLAPCSGGSLCITGFGEALPKGQREKPRSYQA